MKQLSALKRASVSVMAVIVLMLTVFGLKQVDAASTVTLTMSQSGETSKTYYKETSCTLTKDSSWITIKSSSNNDYAIKVSANSTGKGRIGYVYLKRQGAVITTYKVIQPGSTNLSVGPAAGKTATYGKNYNQNVTTNSNWITLYKPNGYNFRMDYSANTTGSTRTGYVYVKEGSTIITTYKITQSATVTVTYNKNGGSGSNFTRSLAVGKAYGKVDNPTRAGYNFTGWYTTAGGGSQVTATTTVTNATNHTLYAHWNAKAFTINFNGNGGSAVSAKTVYYNGTYGELPASERTGYTFAGWFTAASGGDQVTSSTNVTLTADQTLYAHWIPQKFTVTFKDGGTTVSTKTVTYDSTYGDLPARSKTGYIFNGWYTAKSGGNKIYSTNRVAITANQTLYAQWTAVKVTVTYDLNGGNGENYTRSIAYGSTYGKVDDPTRTGYDFCGWYDGNDFIRQITETTLMEKTYDHTLYAKWEEKTFTVSFDSQGGSSIEPITVKYSYGYGNLETPQKAGYTFDGWFTEPTGGEKVDQYTKITLTADQTLYAHWTWVDPETCRHLEYMESVISPASCFTPGLMLCRCLKCDKTWEQKISNKTHHEYDINSKSSLNVPCINCGETKYIGDMSLEEVSLNWERSKGHNYSFSSKSADSQMEILTKWIYAIKKRQNSKTTVEEVEKFVKEIYKGDEGKRIYDYIGDLLYDGFDYGQSISGILDIVGQLKTIGKVGECDLSRYSKVCGKVFLILALTNPDMPWDIKVANIVGEFLPITGSILEGTFQAGRVAVYVARVGVAEGIGSVELFSAVEEVSKGKYDSFTVPFSWLDRHENDLKKQMRESNPGMDDEMINMTYQIGMQETIERELNQYFKAK